MKKPVSEEELARRICQPDESHAVWARSAWFRVDENLAVCQSIRDLIAVLYATHQDAVPEHAQRNWLIKCELIRSGQVELVELRRNRPCRCRPSVLRLRDERHAGVADAEDNGGAGEDVAPETFI